VASAAVPTVRNPVLVMRELPGRASMSAAARDFGSGCAGSVFGAVTRDALLSSLDVDWKRRLTMEGALQCVRMDVIELNVHSENWCTKRPNQDSP
jgi:hypothetical protein